MKKTSLFLYFIFIAITDYLQTITTTDYIQEHFDFHLRPSYGVTRTPLTSVHALNIAFLQVIRKRGYSKITTRGFGTSYVQPDIPLQQNHYCTISNHNCICNQCPLYLKCIRICMVILNTEPRFPEDVIVLHDALPVTL